MTDFEYEKCKTILDYYKGTHEYAAYHLINLITLIIRILLLY